MTLNQKVKILFVEDSEELLNVWVALFRVSNQYNVRAVSKGSAAVEAVNDGFIPDVLVTDYFLGDYNGLQLIAELRAKLPDLKVIVITGNNEDEELKTQAKLGNLKLLIKPVKFRELKREISDLFETERPNIQSISALGTSSI